MTTNTPVNNSLLTMLLNDFTYCWQMFSNKIGMTPMEARIALSRSGDHAVALIAVTHALSKVVKPHSPVTICRRDNESWLMCDGIEYTTLHSAGPIATCFRTDPIEDDYAPYEKLSMQRACTWYMPIDTHGTYLIKGFLSRYGIELPECLQHCITNQDEYESPEGAKELKTRSENMAFNWPLPTEIRLCGYFDESAFPIPFWESVSATELPVTESLENNTIVAESVVSTASQTTADEWQVQANINEPHLRDLEVTIDGLNVFDLQVLQGTSAWIPRIKFIISGDRGVDENGDRVAYNEAADALEAIFNMKDGNTVEDVHLVPHANIDRGEDHTAERFSAVGVINYVINYLRTEQRDCRITGDVLHISVKTVDFDLTERTEAVWK